jgi:hypothetical protein
MGARKLPTLCVKFEQWYFVPQCIFLAFWKKRSSTIEPAKGKLCLVVIALCVFSPNALLGAQGLVRFAIGPGAVARRL